MEPSPTLRGPLTRLLARAFVPGWREPQRDSVRARLGLVAIWAALFVNAILAAFKLGFGLLIGSLALIADALDSAGDLLIGLAGLIGIKVSARAPDPEHPYGHERAEEIATVVVTTLLVLFGLQFGFESARRLYVGDFGDEFQIGALIVAVVSVVAKWTISRLSFNVGRYTGNPILTASGWNYLTDVLASVLAMAALIGRYYGVLWLDPVFAIVIALLLVRIGLVLLRDASRSLLGRGPTPELKDEIHHVACGQPGVVGCEDIEVHFYGRKRRLSMRIKVSDEKTLREGHEIAGRVQRELMRRHADWEPVVHVEPVSGAK